MGKRKNNEQKSAPKRAGFFFRKRPKIHTTDLDAKVEEATASSSVVSREAPETIKAHKRGIRTAVIDTRLLLAKSTEKKDQYIDAIYNTFKSLRYIENTPYEKIEEALKAFNKLFSEVCLLPHGLGILRQSSKLNKSSKLSGQEIRTNFFEPLDADKITDLRLVVAGAHKGDNNTKNNLLYAFLSVYDQVSRNYNQYKLPYHGFRHSLEAVSDVNILMLEHAKLLRRKLLESQPDSQIDLVDFQSMKLLMSLTVLFHDVKFTFNRIDDEMGSVEQLQLFLAPVLGDLSAEHLNIIENLIQIVILGASTPAFINKKEAVPTESPPPMLDNVFEIANSLRRESDSTDPQSHRLCALIAQWMTDVDINRTAIPLLHEKEIEKQQHQIYSEEFEEKTKLPNEQHWDILEQFYPKDIRDNAVDSLRFQLRLTQGLRVIAEMQAESMTDENLRSVDHPISSECKFVRLIAHYQHFTQEEDSLEIDENDIVFLAGKIKAEESFAVRMANSCGEIDAGIRSYKFVNDWEKHERVLLEMSIFLKDEKVSFTEKKAVATALVHVAGEQSGAKNMMKKIYEVANTNHKVIGRQLKKERDLVTQFSPRKCGCL